MPFALGRNLITLQTQIIVTTFSVACMMNIMISFMFINLNVKMDWPMIQRPMRKKLSWIITYVHIKKNNVILELNNII